ncbi:hypothetical protein BGZ50_008269 [Haplosporangium sp. Z 11]|nr:hypothetical protein BGZ50_008269 [Haplosporangium sp. Z 11]
MAELTAFTRSDTIITAAAAESSSTTTLTLTDHPSSSSSSPTKTIVISPANTFITSSCTAAPGSSTFASSAPPCSTHVSGPEPTLTLTSKITEAAVTEIETIPTQFPSALQSALGSLLEGGVQGWLAVLGSMLIHCFVFAPTEFVFGIFELHYHHVFQDSTASSIAFVGTTGSAITYIAGFLSGMVADRFGFIPTAFAGTIIMTLSLVLASFSTQLWHLYVTQGVMFGIGASFAYYPAIAVPSQYFVKNRGLVIGIAVAGTGLGGGGASRLIVEKKESAPEQDAAVSQESREELKDQERTIIPENEKDYEDYQNRNQDKNQDCPVVDNNSINVCNSDEQEKPSFFQSLHMFKDPQFLSLAFAELAASIGYLIPLYYMQTYAVYIGLTAEQGALILGISNGSAFIGRIILGFIADRVSNKWTILACCWGTAFSVMVFWSIATSFGTLLLMGVTFNLGAGAYVSLVPVAIAESFGTDKLASMIGLVYAAGGLAMWGGSPLAGFILDSTRPNLSYVPVIMTAGASMIFGAICVTSWAYFNWKANRSVAASITTSTEADRV